MFGRNNRILMTAVGDPNGGAVVVPVTPAPAQPGAAATPVTYTADDIAAAELRGRNGAYAEARRTIEGKQPKKSAAAEGGTPNTATPTSYRALDRAVNGSGRKLDDVTYARLERAFDAEQPENAATWLDDYLKGFGASSSAATPATANTATSTPAAPAVQTPTTAPVSNGGSTPPAQLPIAEQDMLKLSTADREHLIKTKGLRWYVETLKTQVANTRIRIAGK